MKPKTVKISEAASLLGVGERTIRNHRSAGAPGFVEKGMVDLVAFRPWFYQHARILHDPASEAVRLRILRLTERKLARDDDLACGRKIPSDRVVTVANRARARFDAGFERTFLDRLPATLKGQSEDAIRQTIRGELDRLTKAFAADLEEMFTPTTEAK